MTVTLAASSQSVAIGSNVTLTAVVDGNRSPEPTGTVTFLNGGSTVPGTVSYQNVKDSGGFPALQATLTFAPTSSQSVTAQYSGDSSYEAANSGAVAITAGTPDFSLSANPGSASVSAGSSTTSTISATGTFGFANAVALTCAVTTLVQVQAQYMPTCVFSPSSVTPGQNPATSKLTISTSARALAPPGMCLPRRPQPLSVPVLATLALLLAAWTYLAWRGRPRSLAGATPAVAVLFLLLAVASCGGGGSSPPPPPPVGTTAGQYTLTLTGKSGSLSHTEKFSLTVQ